MIPVDRRGFWYASALALVIIAIIVLLTLQGGHGAGSVLTTG